MPHPDRIEKPENLRGFLFKESPLRANPTWAAWLDEQHPTIEHVIFGDATMGPYASEIMVGSEFTADYIRRNFGEQIKKLFTGGLRVTDSGAERRREIYNSEAQARRYAAYLEAERQAVERANEAARIKAEREAAAAAKGQGSLL